MKRTCLSCRAEMEDGYGTLCRNCLASGPLDRCYTDRCDVLQFLNHIASCLQYDGGCNYREYAHFLDELAENIQELYLSENNVQKFMEAYPITSEGKGREE